MHGPIGNYFQNTDELLDCTGDWRLGWMEILPCFFHVRLNFEFMFFLAQEPSKREIFEECSGSKIERNITIR